MDIKILDSWLRGFLKTKAKPQKIAECLSLCGPSVEKITKLSGDSLYSIEVTTNRVDSASVLGIAREAAAILPRFKIPAKFVMPKISSKVKFAEKVDYLETDVDPILCPRFSAILIKNVKIGQSSRVIQSRLRAVGIRPLNNVVDITNYLMYETGQPSHVFDFDKIREHKMILRQSKAGELITTLDGKTHKLLGGDIVIEDGEERLIDLAGIMGGENSSVSNETKNVLFFVQSYNPINIRKTAMSLSKRTDASALFERGVDSETVGSAVLRGSDLFTKICGGLPSKDALDIYPHPYKQKQVRASYQFISDKLGVSLEKREIQKYLEPLGFESDWKGDELIVFVPSFRAGDVSVPEDILEEIARIYGYHKLPSKLMDGSLSDPLKNSTFDFEWRIKNILKGWGGVEVLTSSLVSLQKATLAGDKSWLLKLKNPLGEEGEYLRDSLAPSLEAAVRSNLSEKEPFFLFEISNVYLPVRGSLPEEKMMLGGIFSDYSFREAKGIVEALLEELNVEVEQSVEDARGFEPNKHILFTTGGEDLGRLGILRDGAIYFEFEVAILRKNSQGLRFAGVPKYPEQLEDVTLVLPKRTYVGEVVKSIKDSNKQVVDVQLADIYKDSYTFRIAYQNPRKTLTNREVEIIRKKIVKRVRQKYGCQVK